MAINESRLKRELKARFLIRPPVDEDPRLLRSSMKGFVLVVLALTAASAGFSSTIYFPGIPDITSDLQAPPIATTLTAALFILSMGIAPVIWASISDYYRLRRVLFILSMLIFSLASLGCALMTNIWGLVVLRCVQAIGASCGQSVGSGVIADLYEIERRGAAFGKYFFGVFIGPLTGPIIGGFLIMSPLSWRATFWFCVAFGLTVITMVMAAYPETYREDAKFDLAITNEKEGAQQQKQQQRHNGNMDPDDGASTATTGSNTVSVHVPDNHVKDDKSKGATTIDMKASPLAKKEKRKPINPIRPFLMLRHPHVLLVAIIQGVAFGCMFAVETIIPDLFETNFGFSSWQTGLSYLGAGVGNLSGAIVTNLLSDRLLLRARAKRGGRHKIEDRLTINLWPCGLILMPFGILLFGWGIGSGMTYWTGIVGFGIQNLGMNQVMTSTSAYLVDATPGYGASVTAAATLVRMILACAFTLAANPMVAAIGPGWTSVFLAGLTYASVVALLVLKVFGHRMRKAAGFEQPAERQQEQDAA